MHIKTPAIKFGLERQFLIFFKVLGGMRISNGLSAARELTPNWCFPMKLLRSFHKSTVLTRKERHKESTPVSAHVHSFGRLTKISLKQRTHDSRVQSQATFQKEFDKKESLFGVEEDYDINEYNEDKDGQGPSRPSAESESDWFLDDIEKQRATHDMEWAEGNHPVFSERARTKAFELHTENPEFWNPLRLANLFRVDIARMRLSLWTSKIEKQAEHEGWILDDSVERLFGSRYGELDYPGTISEVPSRIGYKVMRDNYYFVDDEIKNKELIKAFRHRTMAHYRESPRFPKKPIPPIEHFHPISLEKFPDRIYPNKFKGSFMMVDISKCKDMYNRPIVVRERDGVYRTGTWQDRRYVEDVRKMIKYPNRVPFPRPDTEEYDHVPEYAQVPDDFVVKFSEPKGIPDLGELRERIHCAIELQEENMGLLEKEESEEIDDDSLLVDDKDADQVDVS